MLVACTVCISLLRFKFFFTFCKKYSKIVLPIGKERSWSFDQTFDFARSRKLGRP
jgi:hypothetical protein